MSETKIIPGKIVSWKLLENSEEIQPASAESKDSLTTSAKNSTKENPVRPQVVAGFTTRYKYGEYGSIYVTLNYDIVTNALIEIFITSSQTSARNQAYTNVLARMISNQIKYGVPLRTIYKHMIGIDEGQATFVKFPDSQKPLIIKSIPDLIGNILRKFPTYSHLEEVVFEEAGINEEDEIDTEKTVIFLNREDSERVAESLLNPPEPNEDLQKLREKVQVLDTLTSGDVLVEGTGCEFNNSPECPDAQWKHESGCETCMTCGFSRCS